MKLAIARLTTRMEVAKASTVATSEKMGGNEYFKKYIDQYGIPRIKLVHYIKRQLKSMRFFKKCRKQARKDARKKYTARLGNKIEGPLSQKKKNGRGRKMDELQIIWKLKLPEDHFDF